MLLSMDGVRALFLDRDGVVNCCPGDGYVQTPGEFRFMAGIFPLMRWAAAQEWKLVLVTNQQGVGKGIMSADDLDAIHEKMQSDLAREAVPFDAIYACTHLAGRCDCRKPSPVMIARACQEHGISAERSVLLGDADRDIAMARNAGVGVAMRLLGGRVEEEAADVRVHTLAEALDWLRSRAWP